MKIIIRSLKFITLLFSILGFSAHADFDLKWDTIKHPGLREALFDLYQGDYLVGINRLISLRAYADLGSEQDTAELLLGTLYLSYGLTNVALDIFYDQVEKQSTTSPIQDQLWFYSAKILYQSGDIEAANNSIRQIQNPLPFEIENEKNYINALVLMQDKQFRSAIHILEKITGPSTWKLFADYNHAVALARLGIFDKSIELLQQLSEFKTENYEIAALREKAIVELGFIFLRQQNPQRAKEFLQKAQLKGPISNRALLGLGWAYSGQNQHKKSLVAWLELEKRDIGDPSVLQALLAIPYAFGELEAYQQSLDYYKKAISMLTNEEKRMLNLLSMVKNGALLNQILSISMEAEDSRTLIEIPSKLDNRYLMFIFSSHEYQKTLKNYRDVIVLTRELDEWKSKVDTFKGISSTFRSSYLERIRLQQVNSKKLLHELKNKLADIVTENLNGNISNLRQYTAKARFSMARIYDRIARQLESP